MHIHPEGKPYYYRAAESADSSLLIGVGIYVKERHCTHHKSRYLNTRQTHLNTNLWECLRIVILESP
jgi:hypothetical protein